MPDGHYNTLIIDPLFKGLKVLDSRYHQILFFSYQRWMRFRRCAAILCPLALKADFHRTLSFSGSFVKTGTDEDNHAHFAS